MAKNPIQAARQRKWYYSNIERSRAVHRKYYKKRAKKQHDRTLQQKYGLTPEDLEQMLSAQDNKCAICCKELPIRKDTRIDHCHKTGKVRGVLCHCCNMGLGFFQDMPEFLIEAAKYLRENG